MITKILEVRDEGTFIPVLAILTNPSVGVEQYYLSYRCGYSIDSVILMELNDCRATNDPYCWGTHLKMGMRTMPTAHQYIEEHFHDLKDGDVIDVQYILGETKECKVSERLK